MAVHGHDLAPLSHPGENMRAWPRRTNDEDGYPPSETLRVVTR
jgi:hypothetical protein